MWGIYHLQIKPSKKVNMRGHAKTHIYDSMCSRENISFWYNKAYLQEEAGAGFTSMEHNLAPSPGSQLSSL